MRWLLGIAILAGGSGEVYGAAPFPVDSFEIDVGQDYVGDVAVYENETLAQERATLAKETSDLAAEKKALEEQLSQLHAQEDTLGSKLRDREQEAQRLKATYDGLVANLKKEVQSGQVTPHQILVIGHTDNKPIGPAMSRTDESSFPFWRSYAVLPFSLARGFSC